MQAARRPQVISTEIRTMVSRPLAEVFAYVADFSNLPLYDPYVMSIEKTSPGPVRVGSTWLHRRAQGRRSIDAPIQMTEYEPNRRLSIASGSKGIDVRSTQTFTSLGDGSTEVAEVLEMRLSGVVRLFEPIIRRQVPRQAAEVHRRLKELLEASPGDQRA
jgi:uncharacterized membrane protein